jgi:hypothetical protein
VVIVVVKLPGWAAMAKTTKFVVCRRSIFLNATFIRVAKVTSFDFKPKKDIKVLKERLVL